MPVGFPVFAVEGRPGKSGQTAIVPDISLRLPAFLSNTVEQRQIGLQKPG